MENKRIEYIDALRGFTMLLVVYTHIQLFNINLPIQEVFTLNSIFIKIRMLLFFFISGFILYKNAVWDFKHALSFFKKKAIVQLIPTSVFIAIYSAIFNIAILDILTNSTKNGDWFTITILEFFFFYILSQSLKHFLHLEKRENLTLCIIGVCVILLFFLESRTYFNSLICDTIGIKNWVYFIYFLGGCYIKKYYKIFEHALDHKYFLPCIFILPYLSTPNPLILCSSSYLLC